MKGVEGGTSKLQNTNKAYNNVPHFHSSNRYTEMFQSLWCPSKNQFKIMYKNMIFSQYNDGEKRKARQYWYLYIIYKFSGNYGIVWLRELSIVKAKEGGKWIKQKHRYKYKVIKCWYFMGVYIIVHVHNYTYACMCVCECRHMHL